MRKEAFSYHNCLVNHEKECGLHFYLPLHEYLNAASWNSFIHCHLGLDETYALCFFSSETFCSCLNPNECNHRGRIRINPENLKYALCKSSQFEPTHSPFLSLENNTSLTKVSHWSAATSPKALLAISLSRFFKQAQKKKRKRKKKDNLGTIF